MLFSKRCLTAFAVLALLAGANHVQSVRAAEGEDGSHKGFIVSFEDAKTKATSDEKDIFMEFTGSDWCPPCKALYKNVLSTEEFLTQAPENFVLLMIENPRDKSKQTQEVQDQTQKLVAEYKIWSKADPAVRWSLEGCYCSWGLSVYKNIIVLVKQI